MREKEQEKDTAISELMKISLELKDRLDQEAVQSEIMAHVGTDKSVEEIEDAVKDFDANMEKAIEEAEKSPHHTY